MHWIALAEYSQMSTHLPGFISFSRFLDHFVLAKLATSSIRVNLLIFLMKNYWSILIPILRIKIGKLNLNWVLISG